MSFMDALKDIGYKIDSSEKTTVFLAILQSLAAISLISYTFFEDSRTDIARLSISSTIIFQLIVLSFLFFMLFISGKYRAIKLRLNRNTGALYDTTTGFKNVSLTAKTLETILDGIDDSEKARETGKIAGEEFYTSFEEKNRLTEKNYKPEVKLKKWLEYDSSSGMGKFEVFPHTPFEIKLKIGYPFVGDCGNQNLNTRCSFLLGYVEGVCSKLYDKELKTQCEHNSNPPFCILTLEPAN